MKILHINSYLVDRFFYDGLYREQIKDGNDIDVYVSVPKGGSHAAEQLGAYVRVAEDHLNWQKLLYFPKQKRILASVKKTYDVASYDLLHAHSWYTNGWVAMKAAQQFHKPYVVAVRNGDVNNFYKKVPFLRGVGHSILLNAAVVVFLSETYRKMVVEGLLPADVREKIQDKCVVIPNGIDSFWLEHPPKAPHTPDLQSVRAIYAGEITKNKNIAATVSALELLRQKGYMVSLTVVGAVKDKEVFEDITKAAYVHYHPKMVKEDLINAYRDSDVFVMPSFTEAFGLVYAEAMSQGLPVLYTKGQGFDGQFPEGEAGYAVDSRSPADIADKLLLIWKDYAAISQRCVAAARVFSWQRIAGDYAGVYRRMLHDNAKD